MKQAVLLLAHGAPERVEDVEAYMRLVRGGRPTPASLIEEVRHRYELIGGSSPLTRHTREQAEALSARLGLPVYFGMRNWYPSIQETAQRMQADGIERVVAICLAPQYSKLSVGLYFRRVQEAKHSLGWPAEIVWTKSFHQHPLLIQAFSERLSATLSPLLTPLTEARPQGSASPQFLFTAHSLPEKILDTADPYDTESKATAAAVAQKSGLSAYDFAYQSQGATDDKWLGPTVESRLDAYAARGLKRVLLHPIGFVCDHVEILYDVDILFRTYARERGIELFRPESLNDSPTFTAALADVALQRLSA